MELLAYCRLVGIQIDAVPPIGVWKRYRTDDKPQHFNGRVKNMGTCAYIQNFATMANCQTWRPEAGDAGPNIDHAEVARVIEKQRHERHAKMERAASKAAWILGQCRNECHPYLASHGFPLEQGNVYTHEKGGEKTKLLVIPMRVDGHLVSLQMIDPEGKKKFLTDGRTEGAVFVMDSHGRTILCEGMATALSVRVALQALRMRYKLVVAFSASNMARIADGLPDSFIVADNDISGTGQRIALESGRPFFLPPVPGNDFNDWLCAVGTFKASQALRIAMLAKPL